MKLKHFETAYERRMAFTSKTFTITIWSCIIVFFVLGGLGVMIENDLLIIIGTIASFGVHSTFWIIFFPIALKGKRVKKIQSAEFYKTISQDSIYTKLSLIIVISDMKRKRVKNPVTIDKIGLRNEEIEIVWQDCQVVLQTYNFFGSNTYSLALVSKKDNSVVEIPLDPKGLYLFKNFSGLEIKNVDVVEDWVRQTAKLTCTNKKKAIPEGAEVFKSRFWLVFSVAMVGVAIFTIPIAYALSFLGDWLITLALFIFVPAVMPLWYKLPRGTTYISKEKVYSRNLDGAFSFDIKDAQIIYGKITITIKSETFSVLIYKTKRAKNWIEQIRGGG